MTGAVLDVDRVDEAHLLRDGGHHEAVGADAVAEEADRLEQGPLGDARRRRR